MNSDILKGNWKQLKGQAKETWGKLTDDTWDRIDGQREVLIGKLQEKYGYTRREAEESIEDFLDDFQDNQ